MSKKTTASVGDWVRFYQNGNIVIGSVQYIETAGVIGTTVLKTDVGAVEEKHVLEIRGA